MYDFGMVTRKVPLAFQSLSASRKAAVARLRLSTHESTRRRSTAESALDHSCRQRGALSFAISHQIQNVSVFEPLQSAPTLHLLSTTILHCQKVSTGRGCRIRSGTLDRKRRDFSSETGTQAFMSSTRDSICFLVSFSHELFAFSLLSAGIFEIELPLVPLCQQHRDEFGHVLIFLIHLILASRCHAQAWRTSPEKGEGGGRTHDSSQHLRLCLDRCIRHSAFHFSVNVLSGLRLVSRCRLVLHAGTSHHHLSLAAL